MSLSSVNGAERAKKRPRERGKKRRREKAKKRETEGPNRTDDVKKKKKKKHPTPIQRTLRSRRARQSSGRGLAFHGRCPPEAPGCFRPAFLALKPFLIHNKRHAPVLPVVGIAPVSVASRSATGEKARERDRRGEHEKGVAPLGTACKEGGKREKRVREGRPSVRQRRDEPREERNEEKKVPSLFGWRAKSFRSHSFIFFLEQRSHSPNSGGRARAPCVPPHREGSLHKLRASRSLSTSCTLQR